MPTLKKHTIGIKVGTNWTNIAGEKSFATEFKDAGTFGISYDYNFKKNLFTSIEFNCVNRKVALLATLDDGINQPEKVYFTMAFKYLSFPLKFGYKTNGKFQSLVDVGLVSAFLNKASTKEPVFNEYGVILDYQSFDLEGNLPSFVLGGMAELGLGYKIGPQTLILHLRNINIVLQQLQIRTSMEMNPKDYMVSVSPLV